MRLVPLAAALFALVSPFCVSLQTSAQTPAATAPAQKADLPGTAVPTLRARAQLVVVDVVVTDNDHKPVKGLQAADFAVLENKTPQTVKSFEEHSALSAADAAKIQKLPPMPPGVFTNYVPTPPSPALNILLLDALNTPLQDQAVVRKQLLDFVKHEQPGTSVAVFGLGTKLLMLQGFTSNPEVLRKVVEDPHYRASPLLDDALGGGGMPETEADLNADGGSVLPADVVARMQTFDNITQSFQLQLRAKYTLDAMNDLARWLSSFPGRKNLIWFSGSFPLDILPDVTGEASDPFAGVADSEAEYRETTNLLARSQVSVYPIDARGLMTNPMFSAASSGRQYARNPNAMVRDAQKFNSQQADEHSTMYRMAEDTGGRAFVNTNGLSQAVASAIEAGSSFYTIAYTPTNDKWRGDYRRIAVKLNGKSFHLEYRHGYYADDPNSPTSVLTAQSASGKPVVNQTTVQKSMYHGAPGATQVLYKVRIVPATGQDEDEAADGNRFEVRNAVGAKPPFRRYSIDYAAVPSDLTYTRSADGIYHGAAEFIALVYEANGSIVNALTKTIRISMTPRQFSALMRSGLPFHEEISVPVKGQFWIRTGIHDLNGDKVGTTEIAVALVKNLPALSVPAQAPAETLKPKPGP
jgi:VWFA-related protein